MNNYLYKEIDFDGDGGEVFDLFVNEPHCFFLDSSLYHEHRGRYSFIGFDPFEVYRGFGKTTLEGFKKRYDVFSGQKNMDITPLPCGVVGFLGYDYGLYQENISQRNKDDLDLPDAVFGFYDCVLTIDHLMKKIYVVSSGLPEKNERLRMSRAQERLKDTVNKIILKISHLHTPEVCKRGVSLECNFSKDEYLRMVQQALDYISAGDIYQVNLSQRFRFDVQGRDFKVSDIYKSLRQISPAPFASYFDAGDFQIISSSPERFLSVKDCVVQTRPMKGTRPRGKGKNEDDRFEGEISNSDKDKAELLMITDLMRNDLGRVCDYGSVCVKEMRTIEKYSTVFQATSRVEGLLRKDKDCFDVLEACFPGGSITGCPKIRAMEVIEELEPTRRGIYTGSLGYINFAGDMDFNILIRTLLAKKDYLDFQVGGGIVADSTPEGEYEETLVKAKAIKECLEKI